MKHLASLLTIAICGSLLLNACVKKSYDPPKDLSGYDPGLPVTHTIEQLKAMNGPYNGLSNFDTSIVTEDVTVAGVVTADDRSGNFFKSIVIQDSTGAITINIDAYSLYNDYPRGRKIYIKCRGLYLGYDGGLPVLGSGINEQKAVLGLEGTQIADHIIKADIGHVVKDTVISFLQAKSADPFFFNRLVTVTDIEFVDSSAKGMTYTEPSATTNRYLVPCTQVSTSSGLVVRSSNYANFHAITLPKGHGTATGIYTVYKTGATTGTAQLIIRDTTDIKLYEDRCNAFANSIFLESFNSGTTIADVALTGWTNYTEAGSVKWKYGNGGFAVNKPYVQVSAYSSGQANVVTWLITPGVSLAGQATPKLSFLNTDGYDNGALLKVFASIDYIPGEAPSSASWTLLNPKLSGGHSNTYGSFISSGKVDLAAFSGKTVYIAFKYIGGDPDPGTTTFEIDDVKISKD